MSRKSGSASRRSVWPVGAVSNTMRVKRAYSGSCSREARADTCVCQAAGSSNDAVGAGNRHAEVVFAGWFRQARRYANRKAQRGMHSMHCKRSRPSADLQELDDLGDGDCLVNTRWGCVQQLTCMQDGSGRREPD